MLKNLLFISFLAFSSSTALLNKAPLTEPQNQLEPKYYTDYIDLRAFNNVSIDFLVEDLSGYFEITAYIDRTQLTALGLWDNDFKYLYSELLEFNDDSSLGVLMSNKVNHTEYIWLTNQRLTDKKDTYGFSLVTDYFNYSGQPDYNYLTTTWLDFDKATFAKNPDFKIIITIPYGFNDTPPYQYYFTLMNMRFFNQKYYDYYLLALNDTDIYDKGYFDGMDAGYVDGYNDGLIGGYENGYNIGYNDGVASDFNAFSWLTAIFSSMGALLSIQLLPGVTIGGIAVLVLVLTLLPFLIKLLKGDGE